VDDDVDPAERFADEACVTYVAHEGLDTGRRSLERCEVERAHRDPALREPAQKVQPEKSRATGNEPGHACLATTASIRAPARTDGPRRPETFERPPRRAREGTST